jgi:hypothetical protein
MSHRQRGSSTGSPLIKRRHLEPAAENGGHGGHVKRALVFFLLAAAGSSAQIADPVLAHVTVLASPDAREGALDRTRIASQLNQIVGYLRLPVEQLPNIVVIYADAQTARIDGMPERSKVTVARIIIEDTSTYQVWITGHASDENTVQGLIWALNRAYGLHLGEARINDLRDRIVRQAGEVIRAGELAKRHH